MSAHETLGLLLVREGLIARPELYEALRLQRQTGQLLGTCLLRLGYIRAEALLGMLAKQLSIPALPPGALEHVSVEAVRRVPAELAVRLRVLPYSWDGAMLGVAVADGNVLGQLQEIAFHTRSAVGAYVALETEIDAMLRRVYPMAAHAAQPQPAAAMPPLAGDKAADSGRETPRAAAPRAPEGPDRPRPPRLGGDEAPVNALDLGPAVLRKAKKPSPEPRPQVQPEGPGLSGATEEAGDSGSPMVQAVIACAPPPAASPLEPLERVGFFDAVEQIYEAPNAESVACFVGRALLNYFTRVMVAIHAGKSLRLVGCAGIMPQRTEVPGVAMPLVARRMLERQVSYGRAEIDARAAELASVVGFEVGATALIVAIGPPGSPRILAFADNGQRGDLYEDMHDVELLLKEAETGLGMLLERVGAP